MFKFYYNRNTKTNRKIIYIILSIVFIDQISKRITYVYLQPQAVIPVINRVFYLNYFENSGVAFEILQKNTWLFLLITSILIIIATYFVLKDTNISNAARLGKALIIGGLIGNLMDRVIYGFIIDFIDIFECPVFNLADISIVLGICILLYSILFNKHRTNI